MHVHKAKNTCSIKGDINRDIVNNIDVKKDSTIYIYTTLLYHIHYNTRVHIILLLLLTLVHKAYHTDI